MPILNWIAKEKIENHDKDVPFRLLKKNKKLSLGDKSENLIVEGDNLEALKALMPFYYGKVKCIYIDPPYNTGNEGWVYNDKVNSPKIKEWLGKAVGPEGEDLTRHDKWLCMMYPRLKLLHDLLRDDGVIFISIDDNEHCNLRMIMDEIFSPENFIGTLIWQRAKGGGNAKDLVRGHDYVLVYKKTVDTDIILTQKGDKANFHFQHYEKHPENYIIKGDILYFKNDDVIRKVFGKYVRGTERRCEYEDILKLKGAKVKQEIDQKIKNSDYVLKKNKNGRHYVCRLEPVADMRRKMYTIISGFLSEVGKTELDNIGLEKLFDYPKPSGFIKILIDSVANKNSIILDSFAGSGTTAQAVLELNKEDGGNRKFILVEMEKKIAREITQERIRRVTKQKDLKGNFEYVELGDTLFSASGTINEKVSFEEMASYVYFTETLTNIEKRKIKGNFIGEHNGTEYFLLFKQKDENILNRLALKGLKKDGEQKVIYADKCLLGDEVLKDYGIIFKQIPYSVKIY